MCEKAFFFFLQYKFLSRSLFFFSLLLNTVFFLMQAFVFSSLFSTNDIGSMFSVRNLFRWFGFRMLIGWKESDEKWRYHNNNTISLSSPVLFSNTHRLTRSCDLAHWLADQGRVKRKWSWISKLSCFWNKHLQSSSSMFFCYAKIGSNVNAFVGFHI